MGRVCGGNPDYVANSLNEASIGDGVTPARSQTFQYDGLSRLTQAVGVYGTIDYSYDVVGNRTAKLWDNGSSTYGETYAYGRGRTGSPRSRPPDRRCGRWATRRRAN